MRRLPGRSGISSVASSATATKPGASPRGVASERPSASAEAITTKGESAMKAQAWRSSRANCLRTAIGNGSP